MRLSGIIPFHKRADTAVIIGERQMWGQNIASRAITLATSYAFGELDLLKLTAGMLATNTGSIRAFEKAGFSVEARGRCIIVSEMSGSTAYSWENYRRQQRNM